MKSVCVFCGSNQIRQQAALPRDGCRFWSRKLATLGLKLVYGGR